MSERAKEIAQKIIADVWPTNNCQSGWIDDVIRPVIEAAVEKHMPRPHQVRDRYERIWEQQSMGSYAYTSRLSLENVKREFGPLTEVQGEPLPDVAAMKVRIAELEKQLDEAKAKIDLATGIGATLGESKPKAVWQLVSENSWVFGDLVRGAVRNGKANVYFNGRDWVWYLTSSTVRGESDYFSKAIEAAEKAMGAK